ncbi:hypothetical protein CQY20_21870 [Mycolicibacterium agri]|nr:hypothetical protein CQY20_21870 [Mycolicibacterium agri]
MLQRLAYLGTEPPMVRSGDYGADLFGGSELLHRVPPWERLPVWRRKGSDGPISNFDLALHLDFEDWEAFRAYAADPTHDAASKSNEVTSFDEFTARVDWYYDGDAPPTRAGHVKHAAMFIWKDEASEGERAAAIAAVESLTKVEGVERALVGHNVGNNPTDYDWIMDLELPDPATTRSFLEGSAYREAMNAVAAATKYEWTARLSHVMHRP